MQDRASTSEVWLASTATIIMLRVFYCGYPVRSDILRLGRDLKMVVPAV